MKCPKCDQDGAKQSQTYPDIIVYKYDGIILKEVRTYPKNYIKTLDIYWKNFNHISEKSKK